MHLIITDTDIPPAKTLDISNDQVMTRIMSHKFTLSLSSVVRLHAVTQVLIHVIH